MKYEVSYAKVSFRLNKNFTYMYMYFILVCLCYLKGVHADILHVHSHAKY